jgi:hypothetical protein
VQENPKYPSVLLVGVDTSESMTVKDEVNNQARVDAVRRTLEKCQPLLDELAAEQNVTVHLYKFSAPDFNEATAKYTPGDPADGKRSDYGTFLNRLFDRWLNERFVRGLVVIGDGADNGEAFSAVTEASRWARRAGGVPVTTVTVGGESGPQSQDIVVTGVDCDPSPAPVKTEVTVSATVHAYGFAGARVVARVYFDGEAVKTQDVVLEKEKDNRVRLTVKAPETKGEVKVRLVIGHDQGGEVVPVRGELSGENNQSETYLTVTKDGVRVLVIDRLRDEASRVRDALRTEKRFDLNWVFRQTDGAVTADQEKFLDLSNQAYDVVVIGNVTPAQLTFTRNGKTISVLDQLRDAVLKKGTGVMFLGGEHAFRGMPADLLPVTVPADPAAAVVEDVDKQTGRPNKWYQTVPTADGLAKMFRLAKDEKDSVALWGELNTPRKFSRLTGYNKMTRKPGSMVYAWTTADAQPAADAKKLGESGADPLLVGDQIGDGAKGRVLAFAGYDSYLWEKLGQPKTAQGSEIHHRFWRQSVLWLAHQDEEEGQAYVRPAQRQLKVGGEQTLRVGVKRPGGGDDPSAELTVKVVPLPDGKPEPDPAELDKARPETVVRDKDGAKVLFRPRAKGEYFVQLTSPKKDDEGRTVVGPDGKPVLLRGTAKFIALPDTSDEMLRVAADHEFMSRLSVPNGGKALRLEDLPGFLKDLKAQPMDAAKPKPKFYPDWRRNHSHGFLPLWLTVFALLLGAEWGLRRLWGMV